MAIAYVNSFFSGGASSGTVGTVGPQILTAGNLALLLIACQPTSLIVSSISDTAGNTYVSCGSGSVDTTTYRTEVFYAKNCLGNAANTVTVTMNGNVTDFELAVAQYSGAATGAPFDVAVASSGSSFTLISANFTPKASGETAILWGITVSGATYTGGTNYVLRDQGTAGLAAVMAEEDRLSVPAGSQSGQMSIDVLNVWQTVVTVFSATDITSGGGLRMLTSLGVGT